MIIGTLTLENPFILAPLAGYTDLPFRLLCREYGASICYSEMISCHGLAYRQQKTLQMIQTVPEERPVAFQLFGSDPDVMGEGAAILSEKPIDIIDINMGCPVKKVIKSGSGVALMKDPKLAEKIIKKVCANSTVPVSVKFRSGWDHKSITADDFAKIAESCGAHAVIIHARTWAQGFAGLADRRVIADVKNAVSIPVIGNGDIQTYEDGLSMMEETGCDGVMVGRASLGNPWVFNPDGAPANLHERLVAVKRHLELISRYLPVDKILARTKNQAGRYFKGIAGGATIRRKIYDTKSFTELYDLVNNFSSDLLVR